LSDYNFPIKRSSASDLFQLLQSVKFVLVFSCSNNGQIGDVGRTV
jgi:hypothetical protein